MNKEIPVALLIIPAIISAILLFTPVLDSAHHTAEHHTAAHDILDETCARMNEVIIDILPETVPLSLTSSTFSIPVPAATGENAVTNYSAEIDASNAKDGYVMVRYLNKSDKELRVIIKGPSGKPYIYRLRSDGEYEVYPFSEGNGYYQVTVYENVFGNKYSVEVETTQSVMLEDEFAPFIRPNQYVNYTSTSLATKKAAELTKDKNKDEDKIMAIYDYVINNITYDQMLAATVEAGYIPDVDNVLKKGRGICFDYAAVMTAMLRSQGIPAKLVVGYNGKIYHAWVSVYSGGEGNGITYSRGKRWQLMDPTLAACAVNNEWVLKYTNEDNYSPNYFY